MVKEIPEGWETKQLGSITQIKTGKKNNEEKIEDGNYPFFVRSQTVERINSYAYDGEAILIPGEGNIGNIFHYIKGKFDFHQRVYKISDFPENVVGKYVYYYIFQNFKKQAMKNSVKATVDSLRLPTFKSFELLIPKDPKEQLAISESLSHMDELIERLDSLITKKKNIQQGTLQKLLTKGIEHSKFEEVELGGQIKIEIPDCWDTKTLNELSVDGTQNGFAISSSDYGDGFPIVGMTDFFQNDVLNVNNLLEVSLSERKLQKFFLKEDDLLFARRSLNVEGAGKCILVSKLHKPTIFESSVIRMTLQIKKFLPSYVNYFLNSPLGRKILTRIKQVVAVSGITSSDLKKIIIPIPKELDEQKKISLILTDMNSEIELLEKKKTKFLMMKKGMMQKLLTGEIRLK